MNVIPPIPVGSGKGPQATRGEDRSGARWNDFEIEDLTPPMRRDDIASVQPYNEPRLVAMASDAIRPEALSDMDDLLRMVGKLDERVQQIEERFAPSEPSVEPPPRIDNTQMVAQPGAMTGEQLLEQRHNQFTTDYRGDERRTAEADAADQSQRGDARSDVPHDSVGAAGGRPVSPDVDAAVYAARPHNVAEEVREIEFRRPVPDPGQLTLLDVATGGFNGTVNFYGAAIVSGLNSDAAKPWVKIDALNRTASEESGPPPSPWGRNEVWREKAAVFGTIYIDRLG